MRCSHHVADAVEWVGCRGGHFRFGGVVDFDADRLVIAGQSSLANLFLGRVAERIRLQVLLDDYDDRRPSWSSLFISKTRTVVRPIGVLPTI